MKEDNNKAKIMTIGIAVLLIIIICGISFVIHALNKRDSQDSSGRLQTDIMEYANSTQNKNVQAEEVIKEETEPEASATEPEKQTEENAQEPAMVVEQEKAPAEETIMEEEANSQAEQGITDQKKTAKWQRDASEDLSKVEIDLSRQMAEMKGYWESGNMKAVEDLAYLPRYRAASEKLSGSTKYYYFGDTDAGSRPNGKGLAMYADNQYYYGEWQNGVRSGSGMWIKYYVYDQNAKAADSLYQLHSYSGNWSNDLPNGDGTEHYDFIVENMEKNVGYNRNFIGSFKNGLYNGEIYITNYYSDDNTKEWSGNAVNGVWQPMGEKDKKGQYPVIVELTDEDNYQWMAEKENVNQGVKGLISAAKK